MTTEGPLCAYFAFRRSGIEAHYEGNLQQQITNSMARLVAFILIQVSSTIESKQYHLLASWGNLLLSSLINGTGNLLIYTVTVFRTNTCKDGGIITRETAKQKAALFLHSWSALQQSIRSIADISI